MEDKILAILERIRPALSLHNGDLEYCGYRKRDKAVLIRFTGTCGHCSISHITLQHLVMRELQTIPEIKKVVSLPS